MKEIIRKVLREESEESTQEFIEKRTRMLNRVEKTIPKLIKFLQENLSDIKLYDIDIKEKSTAYGSTWVYDEEKGKESPYVGKSYLITLKFAELTNGEKQDVGNRVYDYIEDVFGIPITKYGTPLSVKFINLEEKEF